MKVFSPTLCLIFACLLFPSPAHPQCLSFREFFSTHKDALGGMTLQQVCSRENYIGGGSFGKVFKNTWYGKPAAYKHNEIKLPLYRTIFLNEARYMGDLRGVSGVIEFYGCLEANMYVGFFHERLADDLDKKGSDFRELRPAKRVSIYKRLAETLDRIHDKQITHNDIKPENFMATDDDFTDVKLIEFGMSCQLNQLCFGGSPLYNAPEKIVEIEQSKRGKFTPSIYMDSWAFLVFIAVMENEGKTHHNINVPDKCLLVEMSDACYRQIKKNIESKMMDSSPDELRSFVLSGLEFEPTKRPEMNKIATMLGHILNSMETQVIL